MTAPTQPAPDRRVSVIIPAFNAERYLGEALASVLAQTVPPAEVIVVDDGSTDGTVAVAEAFGPPVRCVRQPHAGASRARNLGVAEATGALLAFLDADDLWAPDKLALQLAALEADPAPEIVFGRVVQFRSPELTDADLVVPDGVGEPVDGPVPGTMLTARTVVEAVGPFAEDDVAGDFIDWYARALDQERSIVMLPDVVLRRRLHLDNLGRRLATGPAEYAKVVRRMVERRRGRA